MSIASFKAAVTEAATPVLHSDDLLGIYLNDHLAGATAGCELFGRSARALRGSPEGAELARLADEVAQDREALRQIMLALDKPVREYKMAAAWTAEKFGRLKPNGRLLERSPLSALVELEGLRLGVEGKAALWKSLLQVADHYPQLSRAELDALLSRAETQLESLERLRLAAAARVLAPFPAP
jgi:hypothetical protein